jgi:hypothetical protein
MRESIVVICPTAQGELRAALWHDGQIGHGWHAHVAPSGANQQGGVGPFAKPNIFVTNYE